jgi:hypothetical protein
VIEAVPRSDLLSDLALARHGIGRGDWLAQPAMRAAPADWLPVAGRFMDANFARSAIVRLVKQGEVKAADPVR